MAVRAPRSLFAGGAYRRAGDWAHLHQCKVVARRRAGSVFGVGAPCVLRHSEAMPPCLHQHSSRQLLCAVHAWSALAPTASHTRSLDADAQVHPCAARTRPVCAGQLRRYMALALRGQSLESPCAAHSTRAKWRHLIYMLRATTFPFWGVDAFARVSWRACTWAWQ